MLRKFLIYAPPYDPNTGGIIALHKLCDLINRSGREAFLYPLMPSFELHLHSLPQLQNMLDQFQAGLAAALEFRVNSDFITPTLAPAVEDQAGQDWVVVYPEIVFGNPLRAPNVVRWMMHKPGYWTNQVHYGAGELHFYYGQAFREYDVPRCTTSELRLTIHHTPFQLYLDEDANRPRSGTAYCLRKGKGRPLQHDLSDSVLIDGKSHEEIATIFKRVKTFISYDLWTTYSRYASLSGCDSVIIPEEGVGLQDWAPELQNRLGIAYGFDDLERARCTRGDLVALYRQSIENEGMSTAQAFVTEVDEFFADRP